MNDFRKLRLPKQEKLEVQWLDGSEEKNIIYVITSLAKIKKEKIVKSFRLYEVKENGSLLLIEKKDSPDFDFL